MINISKIFWTFVGLIMISLVYVWASAFTRAGEFSHLYPRFDGVCQNVGGYIGVEDMAYDKRGDQLIVASLDRKAMAQGNSVRGALLRLRTDLDPSVPITPIDISNNAPADLSPIAVGIWQYGDYGVATLAVVNRKGNRSVIETYGVNQGELTHNATINHPPLDRISDVAPVSEHAFYVTNESDYKSGSMVSAIAQMFDKDNTGSIWYYDGTNYRKVAAGLSFASSIAVSNDGSKVYATGIFSRNLRIYDRNSETGDLSLADEVFLGTGADNIFVDDEGRIFIAAHPKIYTFLVYVTFGSGTPPSQIIVIEPSPEGKGGKVDQVYLSAGSDGFDGATIGAKVRNRLFMGSPFEHSVRTCTLPVVWRQSISHPASRLIDTERGEAPEVLHDNK